MNLLSGWRGVAAAGVGVAAILLSGFALGKVTGLDTAEHADSAARPRAAAASLVPAAVPLPPVAALPRGNPITGPGRPPLPAEAGGPYGSRRTTGTPEVALTFDDGPDPQWTPRVLELLRRYQVKATFCMIGQNAAAFPQLVRAIADDGHTLCNHSWDHNTSLGFRDPGWIVSDLNRTNRAIRAAAPGSRVSYFRQPGGNWTPAVVSAARQLGMTSLHWEVDPQDWRKPGSRSIVGMVNAATMPGAIVLLHDGGGDRRGTADALRWILPNLVVRFPLIALPPGVEQKPLFGLDRPVHMGQD